MAEWKLADAENIRANLTKAQEDEISMLYRRVYLNTRKQMLAIPKDGTTSEQIQKMYLDKLHKQLNEAYKSLGIGLEKQIQKEAKKAAEGVAAESSNLVKKAGFSIEGAYSFVPKDIVNSLVTGQVYSGNWSLSGAIWNDINKHQSDINKIIAEGVAANKSSYDIAKDLEKYVNPDAKKEWDWSKVYPGTSKKIDYNAQRLARTMVSHAYQQSLERVCKNNPFVDGYIWQAGHSTKVCEICEERDGKFFAKGDLPLDHPNGMCTFIAHMTDSLTEVADRLSDWVQGNDDPELDKWMADMTGNKVGPVFNDAQNKWLKPLGYTPENMPNTFKEFALKLSYEQQTELLKQAGGDWGVPHPYQLMEIYYKQNLMSVRQGVIPIVKNKRLPIGMDKATMETMFSQQSRTVSRVLDSSANAWWGSLSRTKQDAVYKYTGHYYRAMNGVLRGTHTADSETTTLINNCRAALNKASSPVDLVVGRGSNADSLRRMLGDSDEMKRAINNGSFASWLSDNKDKVVGSVASDAGFLSTTPYFGGGFTGDITYRIYVPKGSPGVYVDSYSSHQGEKEFLLQAGSTLRVTDIEPGSGNSATVYMEYI